MVQIPSPQSKISLGFTSEGIFLSRQRVPICCPSVVLPNLTPIVYQKYGGNYGVILLKYNKNIGFSTTITKQR